jgi:signal transduction histidine kinase
MSDLIPSAKAQFLGKGIQEMNQLPELNRRLYWIFSSMEKFQKEVQDCLDVSEARRKLMQYIDGMGIFHETAFYRVDDENIFVLDRCSNKKIIPDLEHFVSEQMKSGQFAWALQQNREVIVNSPACFPGEKAILHGLSTRQSTLGMFIGFLKPGHSAVMATIYQILSLMIDSTVYVLENRQLEAELIEHNHKLEGIVDSRTHELVSTNQYLHQSNVHLKKLNEKKSEFLGIVAHDLKNPLNGVLGFAQLIEISLEDAKNGHPLDAESNLNMLKQVIDSARHMADALNQLMNSEVIESGQIQLEASEINISQIARKVVIINNPQANAKSIEILCDIEEDVMVFVDPLRIQEAIDNLISNAIKYSPIKSHVWVKLNREPGIDGESYRVVFSVKDEGSGLSETDKSMLFGRFQKLSSKPTAGESSTGLGLFIFKRLIELHNGEVWVKSELGKGSEFGFFMPIYLRR